MNRPSEPLNAEERDLAQRLARMGGPRAPAPALDAKILAMARAAVDAPADAPVDTAPAPAADPAPATTGAPDPKIVPLRRRTPLQRWPVGLGLAASLVLAAGLGWKLHVASEDILNRPTIASAPAAPATDSESDGFEVGPPLPRAADASASAKAAAAPAEITADASAEPVQQAKLESRQPAPPADASIPAPPPPPTVFAEKAMLPAPAPAAPPVADTAAAAAPAAAAPPPPPPPAAVVVDNGSHGSLDADAAHTPRSDVGGSRSGGAEFTRTPLDQRRQQVSANRSTSEAPAPPPPPTGLSPAERARISAGTTRSGATENDTPSSSIGALDERPPVSADSAEFRQAWLQRIRALIAKGDTTAAIDSLKEFRRRYPDVELPDDLRKLLPATQPSHP